MGARGRGGLLVEPVHSGARRERPGESIGQVYIAMSHSLRKFARRICMNDADAEDIAQEALLCAMNAEADRVIENPKAYLFRIAQNLALRTRNSRSREILDEVDRLKMDEAPCDAPSVEDQVISRERLGILCDALATLPPSCRRVFVMRKVYGYSHREIADRLGISTSTVEKHLATGFARCVAFMRTHGAGDVAESGETAEFPARTAARQSR